MRQIIIDPIPNQSLSVRLDNSLYDITLKFTNGVMSVTLIRDGVTVQSGCRVVAGTPLIPYRYQESGNFLILTENGDLPDYTKFDDTQGLFYASVSELEQIRAGT